MVNTVWSDCVNLASRLESDKKLWCTFYANEFTKVLVSEFDYRELDILHLKEKKTPL